MHTNHLIAALLLTSLLLTGCGAGQWLGPTFTPTPTVTLTPTFTPTVTLTPTFTPTSTSTPTVTLTSTPTPSFTPTVTPSHTPTPIPHGIARKIIDLYEDPDFSSKKIGQLQDGEEFTILNRYQDCVWIKVNSSGSGSTGWVYLGQSFEGYQLDWIEIQADCEALPVALVRPKTGLMTGGGIPDLIGSPWNRLRIYNYSSLDAVLILKPHDQNGSMPEREWKMWGWAFYIRAGENFEWHISSGYADAYFSLGSAWNGYQFTSNAIYRHYTEPLVFRSTKGNYTVVTLTLAEGLASDVEQLDVSEFPDILDLIH